MAKKQPHCMPTDYISVGNISTVPQDTSPKKQSIKIRGTGAATKGTKASDKMG
jgi:hypothetical protein